MTISDRESVMAELLLKEPTRRLITTISNREGPMTYHDLRMSACLKDDEMRYALDVMVPTGRISPIDPIGMRRVDKRMEYANTSTFRWDQLWAQDCTEFYAQNMMFFNPTACT